MSDKNRPPPLALPTGVSTQEFSEWMREVEADAPKVLSEHAPPRPTPDANSAEAGNSPVLEDDAEQLWHTGFAERNEPIPIDLRLRIAAFLGEMVPEPYCDDCISEETASDLVEVRDETERMRTQPDFLVGGTLCTRCGDTKPFTTRANASYVREFK